MKSTFPEALILPPIQGVVGVLGVQPSQADHGVYCVRCVLVEITWPVNVPHSVRAAS